MIHSMRWFGPKDPVSLMDIRQAGCSGVVTALHQIPVGDIWSIDAIKERQSMVEADNGKYSSLNWLVVESLPVHEDIKKGLPTRELYIENYKKSLQNLATCGVKIVCYNFMPVLDWSRTDLNYEMPDGSRALRFVWEDFAIFDLYILKRPNASADYSAEVQLSAKKKFETMSSEDIEKLKQTALLGLPGSDDAFELNAFQKLLDSYKHIGDAELRKNLYYFVQQVAPFAQQVGVNLCIHPDDPPFPLLGLPRVVSTEKDLTELMNACDIKANGITFCTGSLGVRPDNDIPKMIRRFADRIHFIHLRTTKRELTDANGKPLIFHEAAHLDGDVDMVATIREILLIENNGGEQIPMRPDHGHQMMDDLNKKTYPGYSAIGRLKGLAELRGVEIALKVKSEKLKVKRAITTASLVAFFSIFLFYPAFAFHSSPLTFNSSVSADDGYRLWLKYDLVHDPSKLKEYKKFTQFIKSEFPETPVINSALKELKMGLSGLLGISSGEIVKSANGASDKSIGQSPMGKGGIYFKKVETLHATSIQEGFKIENQNGNIIISAQTDKGILYGVFNFLREIQTGNSIAHLNISNVPKIQLRMLNHWDNVLGTIERGYAGSSLWKWYELPEVIDPRYIDYARANASIGINAVVLNNVNASARFLTKEYLPKVKALADVFRVYGIQVFLSVNFASPKILGGLKTSDPLDPSVRNFWNDKVKEVYTFIPDFGGFLVKANSEGEPGPQEYGRNHADGANMLAEAFKPFNGLVIWRAFVYAANPNGDRFKEAYNEFKPLDGKFAENVIVQVKNGPIDFQAREPFHPLFGAMPKTPLALEFQITQEYLGQSTNLVFLAPLFKECLDADTYANGKGTTVAKIISSQHSAFSNQPSTKSQQGKLIADSSKLTAIAGVANTGSDRNWTGHFMSQANWYAYGRLAWDYDLTSSQIADEWIKMTLTQDVNAVKTINDILLKSRENYVDFTEPLGLHHIMGQSIHFDMEPWLKSASRADWNSVYYHRADSIGIGFDRTEKGSNALSLYNEKVAEQWKDPKTCDLKFLLWYHHVAWTEKLSSGRTLWDELCNHYYTGVLEVETMQQQWESIKPSIDTLIFADVKGRLAVQHREALNWRDACVLYFQTFSKLPIPEPFKKPERTLEELKKIVAIYQLK